MCVLDYLIIDSLLLALICVRSCTCPEGLELAVLCFHAIRVAPPHKRDFLEIF